MAITRQLLDALRGHYHKPGQLGHDGDILLPEVTAPGSNRRCDLLRVGVWQSRGLSIDVHELKTSRSDWLRELDNPAKAEAWWPYSSRFWIVAPPKLIQPEELPTGWGLMEPPTGAGRRRFKMVVKPAERAPKLTMQLLAELLGRAANMYAADLQRMRIDHSNELFQQKQRLRAEAGQTRLDPRTQETLEILDKLEAAMGMRLTIWRHGGDDTVTVEQFAAAFADFARKHVALQRRAEDLAQVEKRLQRALATAQEALGSPSAALF
ncbi:hypothetical protein [Nonomuraea sp. NPDC023979]|uniref:hypothetical protein n=1 Tax=Nonomuraea sp. NPDC023979 TaxID=3154796 RepID=UPI0033E9D64F